MIDIEKVSRKRIREGLSIRKLAKITGCAFSTLARLERGIGTPDAGTSERLARWLKSNEGSTPRLKSLAELSWYQKMEQRLAKIEERIGMVSESDNNQIGGTHGQ